MPFPLVPTPLFANVPLNPGVPIMLRAPGFLAYVAPALLLADALGITSLFLGPQWGIFSTDGSPFAIPDAVVSVDFRRQFRLSDYPIEDGGFASYNKVAIPYDARVTFAVGIDRAGFLEDVDMASRSLDLFDIVTRDFVYRNGNVIHYDYRREASNGVSLIKVDVWLQQVHILPKPDFVKSKAPEGAASSNTGTVQGKPALLPTGQILGGV